MIFSKKTTTTVTKATSNDAQGEGEYTKQSKNNKKQKNEKWKQKKGLGHGRRHFWMLDQFRNIEVGNYELSMFVFSSYQILDLVSSFLVRNFEVKNLVLPLASTG